MNLKIGHDFHENVIFLAMRFRNCLNELLIESMTEIRNQVFKFLYLYIFDNGTSEIMFREWFVFRTSQFDLDQKTKIA